MALWLPLAGIAQTGEGGLPSSPPPASPPPSQGQLAAGDLIKLADDGDLDTLADSALYYYGADGKRYVFPNEKVYFTWFSDFNAVKIVTDAQMASIAIGGNITYKPGSRMVKIQTDPKVYAVSKNGVLRPIASEAVAAALYGSNWNQQIDDVPDSFFTNYRIGAPIADAADYERTLISGCVTNIDIDKLLANPPTGCVDYRSTGFVPSSISVPAGTKVVWIVVDSTAVPPAIASNPHPTHTETPGLESASLGHGTTYSFIFTATGAKGYHNHNAPGEGGTVNVQ